MESQARCDMRLQSPRLDYRWCECLDSGCGPSYSRRRHRRPHGYGLGSKRGRVSGLTPRYTRKARLGTFFHTPPAPPRGRVVPLSEAPILPGCHSSLIKSSSGGNSKAIRTELTNGKSLSRSCGQIPNARTLSNNSTPPS